MRRTGLAWQGFIQVSEITKQAFAAWQWFIPMSEITFSFNYPFPAIYFKFSLDVVSATAAQNLNWVQITRILFDLRPTFCKSWFLSTYFVYND